MAKINVIPGNGNFKRVLTIIQGATGCIVKTLGDTMEIFSFEDFHDLIMDTLTTETNAKIISCTTDEAEIIA